MEVYTTNKHQKDELQRKAKQARMLTIGFYLLSIVVGIGLILLPVIFTVITGRGYLGLFAICLPAGGAVLMSLFPKKFPFDPPGPTLKEQQHPELFELIRSVAKETNQAMPEYVYLIAEFNAFVSQVSITKNNNDERIMGIGLPLLKEMNISEFKGIIAHEFGHYLNGDTEYGAKIYQTRLSIQQTIMALESKARLLKAPFIWYGNKFLEITNSISRNQEFNADRVAAKVAGKNAVTNSLTKLTSKATAFDFFVSTEMMPLIESEVYAPILEGYDRFQQVEYVKEQIGKITKEELARKKPDKYDTHPATSVRISTVNELPFDDAVINEQSAISLINFDAELEDKMIRNIVGEHSFSRFKKISWDDDINQYLFKIWEQTVKDYQSFLSKLTVATIPDFVIDPGPYITRIVDENNIDDEFIPFLLHDLNYAVKCGLATIMAISGWEMSRNLGEPPVFKKGDFALKPFDVTADFEEKKVDKNRWLEICNATDIGNKRLDLVEIDSSEVILTAEKH